jgi:phosphatidylglycerophosphatase C
MEQRPAGVIFDFDGTLVSTDTLREFLLHCCRQRPLWSLGGAALLSPWLIVVGLFGRWIPALTNRLVTVALWWATLGRTRSQLAGLLSSYAEALIARREAVVLPAALQQLRWHRAQGDAVFVVSGSCAAWIEPFLKRLGVGEVTVVASRLERRGLGLWLSSRCLGQEKPALLSVACNGLGTYDWHASYSDSPADVPILAVARRAYIVNASRRAQARVLRVLGGKIESVEWRCPGPTG